MEFILQAFHRGGFLVMSGITLVLLVSLVIIIERSIRYWMQYDLSNTQGFMSAIQKMIISNSIENAIRLCKKTGSQKLLPYVLAEGLKRANDSSEEIQNAIESATLTVMPRANKRIALLGMNANVATLLGLLGTIFGLMHSFGAAATATGAQKQTLLAEGISEALTATSFGLSTALLCIFAHGVLSSKQQAIVNNITENAARLNDLLHTRNSKLKSSTNQTH
jgi:biopolymer transport protein ExbB